MDPTNCSSGTSSDRVILLPYSNDCTANFQIHVGMLSALSAVRIMVTCFQFRYWRAREIKLAEKSGKTRRRIPLLPMLSMASCVALVLFTVLTTMNIANSSNVLALLLFVLFIVPVSLQGTVLYRRIVKLGARIIPLSKTSLDKIGNSSAMISLTQLPWWLKPLVILGRVLNIILLITGLILSPLLAPSNTPVIITFTLLAIFTLIVVGLSVGQLQRVILAIKSCANISDSGTLRQDLDRAVNTLRAMQIGPFVTCTPAFILYLLSAATVIPVTYM
jgi:hypothetical protein